MSQPASYVSLNEAAILSAPGTDANKPFAQIRPVKPTRNIPRDAEGFENLFREYYAPLMTYVRRLTADADLASDVLQDVFLKLWENRLQITVETSMKALLYTMVRNRALNVIRRDRRINSESPADVPDTWTPHTSSAALDQQEAERLSRIIHQWIDELPERRAEAFTLSRFQGLSHREIATIMDVSKRTVETHIVLALRELRQRLDALIREDSSS